ncbi:MAG: HU family DNA-binding protein [Kiritimatiellia bacterium]
MSRPLFHKASSAEEHSMTKRELVIQIAEQTGLTQQQVHGVIQKTLDAITDSLVRGTTIEFRDFGVFEVKTRKARLGRNPNKPENTVSIPPRRIVKFKPGKAMKDKVMKIP